MKKQLLIAVTILTLSLSAQASSYINGNIGFSFNAPLSKNVNFGGDMSTATAVLNLPGGNNATTAGTGFGDFTAITSVPFAVADFSFNPSGPFQINVGAFQFNLTQPWQFSQNGFSVSLLGAGTWTDSNVHSPTAGSVAFSFNNAGGDVVTGGGTLFAFGVDTVPDAGSTVALLGIAFVGLVLIPRRKLA
jgi:hypothetical protein